MFVNETKNDLDTNVKSARYMTAKSRTLFFVASIIVALLATMMLLLEIFAPSDEGADYFTPIMFYVLAVIMGLCGVFLVSIMKLSVKKLMQGKEGVNKFTFNEDGYTVETVLNDGTTSNSSGVYSGFTAGKEYKDMWLLYINKATVFAIEKSGMLEGSAEDLSALFARNLGSKYKVCYKIK